MNGTREGFTIVEVVISMVMLAIILTTLGGLTFASARQAVVAADASAREAVSLAALNRFAALPQANLAAAAGCDTTGTTNNRYERCVTVTSLSQYDSVRVVITPLQRNVPATTVSLLRSRPTPPNPMCTSC